MGSHLPDCHKCHEPIGHRPFTVKHLTPVVAEGGDAPQIECLVALHRDKACGL
jgi:hypothetical protein